MSLSTHRVNTDIRARSVRVIDAEGAQLGIMDTRKAIELAEEHGLDLVEVSPNTTPPVCKVMNYGKFVYELKKKAKEALKNQKTVETKELKLRVTTGLHDMEIKARKAREFFADGNKVKLNLDLKGREHAHPELGEVSLMKFFNILKDEAVIELPAKREGNRISMVLIAKKD